MNFEPIKKLISKFINSETTKNQKIYYTLSLGWIIFIGYLTWWNGLRNPSLDKSFRWDEDLVWSCSCFISFNILLYLEEKRIVKPILSINII